MDTGIFSHVGLIRFLGVYSPAVVGRVLAMAWNALYSSGWRILAAKSCWLFLEGDTKTEAVALRKRCFPK